MKKYILSASFFCMLNVSGCESTWSNHYVEGMQFFEKHDYGKAKLAFTQAVELTKKDDSHIFIKSNRAKTFLRLGEFYKVLEDINEVIDCPTLSTKDLIDALEIRMKAYCALEMHHKFQEDYIWYKSLNPYMPTFEYTEKHVIIRHCEMMKEFDHDFTYGLFIASGICLDESNITKFNDMIIIERKGSSPCPCSLKLCSKSDDKDKDEQRILNCHKNCDLVAHTASEIAGKLVIGNINMFGMIATIEMLRHECKKCCGQNGGFYMNCIQPIADYCQLVKNKFKDLLNLNETENEDDK